MKIKEIIGALPDLTQEELSKLQEAISFFKIDDFGSQDSEENKELVSFTIRTINTELALLGYYQSSQKELMDKKHVRRGVESLWDFIKTHWSPETRQEKILLAHTLIKMTIRDLIEDPSITTNASMVCGRLRNIRHIFEKSFPGYIQSNLHWLLFRTLWTTNSQGYSKKI
jgi:hypothetical protein